MAMTKKKTNAGLFIALCTLVYFTSYITRKVYASTMIEIIRDLAFSNEDAGLVNTALFITYGAGQIISGVLGDHIAPHKLIFCGIVTSSVCNLLMPLCPSMPYGSAVAAMTVLWAINGFCQALFWPPLVRMMAEHLNGEDYSRACVTVSVGSSFATVCIYLTSSLFIALSGWQLNFYIAGAFGLVVAAVWIVLTARMEKADRAARAEGPSGAENAPVDSEAKKIPFGRLVILSGLIPICVCIVLQGMLRDGLDSWMPTLIADTFDLSSALSTLSGVVMPLFAMLAFKLAEMLEQAVRHEMKTTALLFALAAVLASALYFLYDCNVILSVLLIASLTGCMHGINLILITWVPRYFARYGRIATFSGILNAFTYIGSAIAMYGFGAISDKLSWQATIVSWLLIAGLGIVLALSTIRRWSAFVGKTAERK